MIFYIDLNLQPKETKITLAISIEEFKKVLESLEEAIDLYQNAKPGSSSAKAFRDASIQRFEFCIELAWKTSKKVMGTSANAPKTIIREMAQSNFISDVNLWFDFLEARNKSSHTYDEDIAIEVFQKTQQFLPQGKALHLMLTQA